ncbi:hypothetical protein [uncultured Salinisphaera sp.]|uniref:hypothetical protein n=1 Tax=uncultured Salinisphaera sp. TaxID=359372 RepID=UPI0032B295A5
MMPTRHDRTINVCGRVYAASLAFALDPTVRGDVRYRGDTGCGDSDVDHTAGYNNALSSAASAPQCPLLRAFVQQAVTARQMLISICDIGQQ